MLTLSPRELERDGFVSPHRAPPGARGVRIHHWGSHCRHSAGRTSNGTPAAGPKDRNTPTRPAPTIPRRPARN